MILLDSLPKLVVGFESRQFESRRLPLGLLNGKMHVSQVERVGIKREQRLW